MASFYSSLLLRVNIGGGGGSGSVTVPDNETWVVKNVVFNNNAGGDNFWQVSDSLGTNIAGGAIVNASGGLNVSPGAVGTTFFGDVNINGIQIVETWQVLEPGDSLNYQAGDATAIRVSGYRLPM